MASPELPKKDSPYLQLAVATPEEVLAQTQANSVEWCGALSFEAYLRREEHLAIQQLTENGGLTPWMLVYQPPDGSPRQVLCGCESILKKALVAQNGKVEDAGAHGIGSVFCPPKYRGKGFAGRLMAELGNRLRGWQTENGKHNAFSVLYSDIGKDFYAARGWQPFPSAHVSLPATPHTVEGLPSVRTLQSRDLAELCSLDERLIRRQLAKLQEPGRKAVALVPDIATLDWHHARETFVSKELYGRSPSIRGAIAGEQAGSRVWCYWTRVWTNPQGDDANTMHILRLVVEDDRDSDFRIASETVKADFQESPTARAIAALLATAQSEASQWDMKEVQIWNPNSLTLAAARLLEATSSVVHREEESIASLHWYGEGSWKDVDWVCNEKYGWC